MYTREHATTQQELYRDVCKLANAMKAQGVKKGDVVMIYMPMVRTQSRNHLGWNEVGRWN